MSSRGLGWDCGALQRRAFVARGLTMSNGFSVRGFVSGGHIHHHDFPRFSKLHAFGISI